MDRIISNRVRRDVFVNLPRYEPSPEVIPMRILWEFGSKSSHSSMLTPNCSLKNIAPRYFGQFITTNRFERIPRYKDQLRCRPFQTSAVIHRKHRNTNQYLNSLTLLIYYFCRKRPTRNESLWISSRGCY